jgi:serine protease AprX
MDRPLVEADDPVGLHGEAVLTRCVVVRARVQTQGSRTVVGVAITVAAALAVAGLATRPGTAWLFSPAGSATPPSTTAAVLSQSAAKIDPGIRDARGARVEVVVQGRLGASGDVHDVLRAHGSAVRRPLPIVDGFEAEIPVAAVDAIASSPSIRALTLDRVTRFEEYSYDSATTASNFVRTTGATEAWRQGALGTGVGVAVIDTGISSMNDLAGRIVFGPDLSGEGTTIDTYGHGTVMAGIIGGSGADSAARTGGAYSGIAPKANLIAVKVAGRNGVADVSTLLQALHWVSAYRAQYNIRVLNLSWGTESTQAPYLDPLNYAVERLWQEGIVVVAAAGNSGPGTATILKPGDDPVVLTVGAFDDKQNIDPADDSVPAWSSRGPTATGVTKPDVLAPGRLLTTSRSFRSNIEALYPKALIAPSYIRGSGTSQAAAVASGVAALLVQQRPTLTPDQVKTLLMTTASPLAGYTDAFQGKGRIRLASALVADPGPASWQVATATGLGSIEGSRGGRNVETDCGQDGTIDVIRGEIDARCEPWNGTAWTGTAWTGTAWTGTAWTGTAWTGTAWTGTAWTGGTWTGTAWTGTAWTGTAWTGSAWTGTAWTGTAWTGTAWTGTAWTGTAWTSAVYEDLFLTLWWGDRPEPWQNVPGEMPMPRSDHARRAF